MLSVWLACLVVAAAAPVGAAVAFTLVVSIGLGVFPVLLVALSLAFRGANGPPAPRHPTTSYHACMAL